MHSSGTRRIFRRLYRWASHRLYHEFAWAYEVVAWLVSLGYWDAWRRQTLDYIVGDRVLELGFGTGALLDAAVRKGIRMWGVDPSRAMHRVTARRLRRRGVSVPRVRSTAQALPFPDGAFHTVVSAFPSEYIMDFATLQQVARVLRRAGGPHPQGRFVLTGIGFRTERVWIRRLLGLSFGDSGEDVVAQYAAFAEAAGFEVTVIEDAEQVVRVPVLILEAM